jgi:hypothetical protein
MYCSRQELSIFFQEKFQSTLQSGVQRRQQEDLVVRAVADVGFIFERRKVVIIERAPRLRLHDKKNLTMYWMPQIS